MEKIYKSKNETKEIKLEDKDFMLYEFLMMIVRELRRIK